MLGPRETKRVKWAALVIVLLAAMAAQGQHSVLVTKRSGKTKEIDLSLIYGVKSNNTYTFGTVIERTEENLILNTPTTGDSSILLNVPLSSINCFFLCPRSTVSKCEKWEGSYERNDLNMKRVVSGLFATSFVFYNKPRIFSGFILVEGALLGIIGRHNSVKRVKIKSSWTLT